MKEQVKAFFIRQLRFSPFQVKIFLSTFICMFLIVSLQHLGINPRELWTNAPKLHFITPVIGEESVLDTVRPKLEKKENTYELKQASSFIPQSYAASSYENAKAYTVVDFDSGEIVAEKNLSQKLPIASLTKIMTAVVALDLASPDEVFTVTKSAENQVPTKLGVQVGEKMTLTELLNAILLTSANDAAEVIKDGINQKYGDDIFVKAMDEKASFLGLKTTSFANPQGFDNPDNYSSAEDLAVLAHYALSQYPLIAQIAQRDFLHIPANDNHTQLDLNNWNGLLGVYPNVSGLKIGNTYAAGMTTVVVSDRENKKLLAVLLGAPGILERDMWTAQLLDAGYQKTAGLSPVNVTEEQLQEKYNSWQYWE